MGFGIELIWYQLESYIGSLVVAKLKMSMIRALVPKVSRQHSAYPGFTGSNPFDSDSESEENSGPVRAFSAPPMSKGNSKVSPFSYTEVGGSGTSSFKAMGSSAAKDRYKNDFRGSGGLENQPLQEVENYAVYKAEETTEKVNNCLKITEMMREDASRTLVNLHQQGEKINRTHHTAASIEHELSMGEKLLGSLGGLFSKSWKPVKSHQLKGPVIARDDSFMRRGSHMEQRQKLGLSAPPKIQSNPRQYPSEHTTALGKIQVEHAKQDDTLSYVSDLLGQLKEMAIDMGSEIDSQNKGLDHMQEDVEILNDRVKGANQRARRLLGR